MIGLLRHGEVVGGRCFRGSSDDPLTAEGLQQMWDAVETDCWDQVISSPLQRCHVFAQAYSQRVGVSCHHDARLTEVDFGDWEGRSAEQLMQTDGEALTRFWQDPLHNTPPGGEALDVFQTRVLQAWSDIVAEHNGQNILVVTHGGVIRTLLCHAHQQPISQLQSYDVGYGNLHCLLIDESGQINVDSQRS